MGEVAVSVRDSSSASNIPVDGVQISSVGGNPPAGSGIRQSICIGGGLDNKLYADVEYNGTAGSGAGVLFVTDGGNKTVALAAAFSSQAISTHPARLCSVLVVASGTIDAVIYDNAGATSGTVLAIIPAGSVPGSFLNVQMPAANGLYIAGGAGSPQLTVSYFGT